MVSQTAFDCSHSLFSSVGRSDFPCDVVWCGVLCCDVMCCGVDRGCPALTIEALRRIIPHTPLLLSLDLHGSAGVCRDAAAALVAGDWPLSLALSSSASADYSKTAAPSASTSSAAASTSTAAAAATATASAAVAAVPSPSGFGGCIRLRALNLSGAPFAARLSVRGAAALCDARRSACARSLRVIDVTPCSAAVATATTTTTTTTTAAAAAAAAAVPPAAAELQRWRQALLTERARHTHHCPALRLHFGWVEDELDNEWPPSSLT